MIKFLEEPFLPSADFADGFSMTKIKADLAAYGCGYDFLMTWCQYKDQNPTAVISKLEQRVIIVSSPLADMAELGEFLKVIGFSTLHCHPTLLNALNYKDFTEYTVLCKNASGTACAAEAPPLKLVYDILFKNGSANIKHTEPDGWYADISHRIRHGTADAVLCDDAAVAVASHITDDAAVISGVAALESFRHRGYGSKALNTLCCRLGKRKVFAATADKTVPFYLKNGFEITDKIAIYETEE